MRPSIVLAALLGGCVTPVGQKVTVLLLDETVPCEGTPSTATLTLDQADDFYQVQLKELSSGDVFTLGAVRQGLSVTFTCPEGFDELLVRHGTILQERASSTAGGATNDGGTVRTAP